MNAVEPALNEAEVEELDVAFMSNAWLESTGHGTGEWAAYMDDVMTSLRPVVAGIVTARLARARAAELRALAEDIDDGAGAYIGHPDAWNAQQARDRMWRDALERRAIRIEDEASLG